MSPRFVHLSVHTEFSLIDSTVRIKPLVKKVADSMPAVAVTDRGNLFALVKFYQAALQGGIKPIAGVDVRIQPNPQKPDIFRALLLVQNDIGYGNLTRLVSRSFQEGQHSGTPVIQRQWMDDSCDGIIMLSGIWSSPEPIDLANRPTFEAHAQSHPIWVYRLLLLTMSGLSTRMILLHMKHASAFNQATCSPIRPG